MKTTLKKFTLRLTATAVLIAGILLTIILNPILTYANKTTANNYTIYHNESLDAQVQTRIAQATKLAAQSELYATDFKLDICLNDGSKYPVLMKRLRGDAFAWGFYNKVVLMAKADWQHNTATLNGYDWNLTQLLAHEMIHCYQYHKAGLTGSNPIAGIPNWKWEGYPEYIARQNPDQQELKANITRLLTTQKQEDNNDWVTFADGTGTVMPYYHNWLLVQYCMQVKHMSYDALMQDTTGEAAIEKEMMSWYTNHGF